MTHSTPTHRTRTLVKLCFALLASLALFGASAFAQPSKSTRLGIQAGIDKHVPMNQALWPWAHNAFNSSAYSGYDIPNQQETITQHLNAGLRMIDIDPIWDDEHDRIEACHGICGQNDAPVVDRFDEIYNWFHHPTYGAERRENEVVLLYLEAEPGDLAGPSDIEFDDLIVDLQTSGLVGSPDWQDGLVYTPVHYNGTTGNCTSFKNFTANATKADVLAAGKNVIIVGAYVKGWDNTCNYDNYRDIAFKIDIDSPVAHWNFNGYPNCSGGDFPGHSKFSHGYNDVVGWLRTGSMSLDEMQDLVGCGVNAVGYEKFATGSSQHEVHIWSWTANEPNAASAWQDCAYLGSSGMIDYSCTAGVRYACKHMTTGVWTATGSYGPWTEGAQTCYETFGTDYEFAVPANGYQNNLLKTANPNEYSLWVNYSDRGQEGDWEPLEQFTEVAFDLDDNPDGKYHRTTTIPMTRVGATSTTGYTDLADTAYEFNQSEGDKIIGDWNLKFDKNMTLSLWFKFDTTANLQAYPRLVELSRSGGINSNAVVVTTDGALRAWCTEEGTNKVRYGDIHTGNLANPLYYDDGEWHHVAYVVDSQGDESRLYVDGTEVASVAGTCPNIQDTKKIAIGGHYTNSTDGFDGTIDDVRIHGVALSPGDIAAAANRLPVSWFHHNEYGDQVLTAPSYGRYVTVTIPRNEFLSLAEVKVLDKSGNNVAQGKTATQSSTYNNHLGSHVASKAVDGNTNGVLSNGSVTHTQKENDPWWRVDLGQNYQISKIKIYNRTDCCKERLNDATVHVGATVNWFNHNQYSRTSLAQRSYGRYVKISLPRNEFLSLAEVRVFDTNGNNVALNKTATQSSTYSNSHGTHVASKAVDGNTNGSLSNGSVTHTEKAGTPWWEVDLGSNVEISEIRIYNRTDCCKGRLNDAVVTIREQ